MYHPRQSVWFAYTIARALAAGMVIAIKMVMFLSEQAADNDVKMVSDLASYGLEVAQVCAKENRVTLGKLNHIPLPNNYRVVN
jgi:hypothetical protein